MAIVAELADEVDGLRVLGQPRRRHRLVRALAPRDHAHLRVGRERRLASGGHAVDLDDEVGVHRADHEDRPGGNHPEPPGTRGEPSGGRGEHFPVRCAALGRAAM